MTSTDLDRARQEFSGQLAEWRSTTERKTGLRLKERGWWILLLAGAVGLALGTRSRSERLDPKRD